MATTNPLLRTAFILLISLLIVACGEKPTAPEPVRSAIVVQPGHGLGAASAFFSGEIRARHESQLAFQVGGKIARRLVDAGGRVQAGTVLATLDPADLRLALATSQAAESAAQADAELAQSEYDRLATLRERQLVSQTQFETQRTALAAAQARLQQARAQLAVSRNQLGYGELRADRSGIVTRIQAETGQVVAPGQVLAVLAQDGDREVEFALPESRIAHVRTGTPARVDLWSAPERHYAGSIREIAPDSDGSRTYRARVALGDADDGVQLGMTARVELATDGHAATLTVPLTAIHGEDGSPAVWLVDPASDQVRLTPVQVAGWRENVAEISAGLAPDAWLVAVGVHKLHEGQRIRPIDAGNRPVALGGGERRP